MTSTPTKAFDAPHLAPRKTDRLWMATHDRGSGHLERIAMDTLEMATFLDQVVTDAERAFGAAASPKVLEQYVREAALGFWMVRRRVTVAMAEKVPTPPLLGRARPPGPA